MVVHEIQRNPQVIYTVLVPNVRGAERALACNVDEVNLVMSVSETHNRANLRMTREQSFAQLADVVRAVRGSSVAIHVSLSSVFGAPLECDSATDEELCFIVRLAHIGVCRITMGE